MRDRIAVELENGDEIEVVVLTMRPDLIQVVLGEGAHSIKCDLKPNRLGSAYVGTVMGREVVYRRATDDVTAEIRGERSDPGRPRRPRR